MEASTYLIALANHELSNTKKAYDRAAFLDGFYRGHARAMRNNVTSTWEVTIQETSSKRIQVQALNAEEAKVLALAEDDENNFSQNQDNKQTIIHVEEIK